MNRKKQEGKGENDKQADGYIGTYYSAKSRGIYHFFFDTESGRMTEPELFYEAPNAKWISINGSLMVFPIEQMEREGQKKGGAGTCFLEIKNGKILWAKQILEEKYTPCYILQKGDYVYTANYHEGNVMVYRLEEGKPSLIKRIENGERAGCHQILLHETYLLVPCLEQDRIRLFDVFYDFTAAGEIIFPKGSGPRHGVFNKAHTKFYVVSERSNELFTFRVNGKEFDLIDSISILPESGHGEGEKAAAIRLTKDERYLYISIRGINILAVLNVERDKAAVIQHVSSGGVHPRDFILSGDEKFLLVVNRCGGGIVSLERDSETGLLKQQRHQVPTQEGVALALDPLRRIKKE